MFGEWKLLAGFRLYCQKPTRNWIDYCTFNRKLSILLMRCMFSICGSNSRVVVMEKVFVHCSIFHVFRVASQAKSSILFDFMVASATKSAKNIQTFLALPNTHLTRFSTAKTAWNGGSLLCANKTASGIHEKMFIFVVTVPFCRKPIFALRIFNLDFWSFLQHLQCFLINELKIVFDHFC